jgi:hypothetical protein
MTDVGGYLDTLTHSMGKHEKSSKLAGKERGRRVAWSKCSKDGNHLLSPALAPRFDSKERIVVQDLTLVKDSQSVLLDSKSR